MISSRLASVTAPLSPLALLCHCHRPLLATAEWAAGMSCVASCLAWLQPRLPVYISLDAISLFLLQLHSGCCHFVLNIMKQTHLLLHWCFWGEVRDLLLRPVWLLPHVLESGWSRSCSCLPVCSLVKEHKDVESALRREEVSASLPQISQGFFKGRREPGVVRILELEGNSYISGNHPHVF